MLAPRLNPSDLTGSITFRLLWIVSLILLPLGAIGIYQTWSLEREVERRAETALLTRTVSGITDQAQTLERAIGSVEALAQVTKYAGRGADCDAGFYRQFTDEADQFIFAGRIERDLTSNCNSFEVEVDVSDNETVRQAFETGEPFAYSTPSGRASGKAVIVFGHPVVIDGRLDHFAALSLATETVIPQLDAPGLEQARALILYNDAVRIMTSHAPDGTEPLSEMPAGDNLSRLTPLRPQVFRAASEGGEDTVYVVIPVKQKLAYVLASYPPGVLHADGSAGAFPAWVFPFLMWLATLIVIYVAISRLVVTPVRQLARRMRRFATNRATPSPLPMGQLPSELREMNDTFEEMANAILRDEAELEHALREKSILVREIHHRVKNNLQLIASIMNMQIRKSRASETSEVVRRLQERVLGLATVHRQMYESSNLTDVDTGPLLREIIRQVLRQERVGTPEIRTDITEAELIPDQAVPLALLAAEAAMNAVRYVGRNEAENGWIEVTFSSDDDGRHRLVVANSITTSDSELEDIRGGTRGLGTQLIQAFAAQLGGTVEIDEGRDHYRIEVCFSPIEAVHSDDAAVVIQRHRGNAA